MILYSSNITNFIDDVYNNKIIQILMNSKKKELYKGTTNSEKLSWENSLKYMADVLIMSNIPKDCSVALEYNLPMTSSRIDFMLFGYDSNHTKRALIFELKQWSKVNRIHDSEILIETFVGNGLKKVVHPSYQAWSYMTLLADFNKCIQENGIILESCSVLHNFVLDKKDPLLDDKFSDLINSVPLFFKNELHKHMPIIPFLSAIFFICSFFRFLGCRHIS